MSSPDPRYGKTGQCTKPTIYQTRYGEYVLRCDDESGDCPEMVNESATTEVHHNGCECRDCVAFYYSLKH